MRFGLPFDFAQGGEPVEPRHSPEGRDWDFLRDCQILDFRIYVLTKGTHLFIYIK